MVEIGEFFTCFDTASEINLNYSTTYFLPFDKNKSTVVLNPDPTEVKASD